MGDTISSQSGGVDINGQANVGGDVAGRDLIKQTVYQGDVPIALALHQLPPPPADFTGRDEDINAILNDIAHGALISGVRGMGGVGKTALALVIADQLKVQYPDAQFFLPLRGASESPVKPIEAMQTVIRAYHPTVQLPDDATQIANLYHSVLDGPARHHVAGRCEGRCTDHAASAAEVVSGAHHHAQHLCGAGLARPQVGDAVPYRCPRFAHRHCAAICPHPRPFPCR
jgi:hypothetical protein